MTSGTVSIKINGTEFSDFSADDLRIHKVYYNETPPVSRPFGEPEFNEDFLRTMVPPNTRVEIGISEIHRFLDERDNARKEANKLYGDLIFLKEKHPELERDNAVLRRQNHDLEEKLYFATCDKSDAMMRMESDIGVLRAYLGTKLFDEIVTGLVKAPEPPPSPSGFNWSEARLVR